MKLRKSKNKKIVKLATKFQPWDYGFNLEMEREMFRRMSKFFTSSDVHLANSDIVARDVKLAVRLLNIIMEEDSACELDYSKREWYSTKYVNPRNAYRFDRGFADLKWDAIFLDHLRCQKAWYLYHKLRYYKMQHMWD